MLYQQEEITASSFETFNWWIIVASIEFLIILGFIVYLVRKKSSSRSKQMTDFVNESRKKSVNMENVVSSIYKSRELYKELSSKCHPDRFVNSNYHEIALNLFQEISKNKRNHAQLLQLKERAVNELKIEFKT